MDKETDNLKDCLLRNRSIINIFTYHKCNLYENSLYARFT